MRPLCFFNWKAVALSVKTRSPGEGFNGIFYMPYDIKHIIHSQKRPAKSHHETILLEAIEKSIDSIIDTCDNPVLSTVTVRLFIGSQLERVLCITNDDCVFPLLNDPEHQEAKDSLYRRFFDEEGAPVKITNLLESEEEYELKNEFIRCGYKTRILIKTNHMGVVAVHSKVEITSPETMKALETRAIEFRNRIVKNIKQTWECKLFGLYQEMDILTSLAQHDEGKAFHQILQFISQHHSIFRCAIFVVHPDSKNYELLAGYPKETHGTSRGWLSEHPLLQNIAETGKDVHITDLAKDPRTKWLTRPGGVAERYGITEIACFPITYDKEVKAAMTVDYAGESFHFNPMIDQGFFQSVCNIISNILSIISKIKRIRLDEDICRIVDHFLHEIRNPLTASAGFARRNKNFWNKHEQWFQRPDLLAELLTGKKDVEKKEEFLESASRSLRNTDIIVRESDRVEEILNEFETFVRLKHGQMKISKTSVSLKGVGRYFESLFHGLEFSLSPGLESREFLIDLSRLHQILFNLFKNAFEHVYKMDYKSILLQPESFFTKSIFLKIMSENRHIVFEVINEGIVPENIKGRIFEPYFTCGYHDGCGLGLPISSELTKLMNGKITFENMTLEGADYVVFRTSFPDV